jgi:hypothetical protein
MRNTKRRSGPPAKSLTNAGNNVREMIPISEGRHTIAAYNSIDLFLSLALDFGEVDHGEHEPGHDGGSLKDVSDRSERVWKL